MTKSITPTGWDVPWSYRGRRSGRWGIVAASVFSITGVLGLPFALIGIFFGMAAMTNGLEGIPVGLGLLGLVGWGLSLLWGNLSYLGFSGRSEKPRWARLHWASTTLYHALLGLGSVIWVFSDGGPGGILISMLYAMLAILAFMARLGERKPSPMFDGEVVGTSEGYMTLPAREETLAKTTAKAAAHAR